MHSSSVFNSNKAYPSYNTRFKSSRAAITTTTMDMTTSRVLVLSAIMVSLVIPAFGQPQPTTTCTPAMLTGFMPCMNFLNGNTRNVITPTPDCCTSVKTLALNGSDCLCQLVSGRSPFQFQINRTLALMLPRACNSPRIPVQCDVANVPIPAPGPGAFAPLLAPTEAEAPAPVEPDTPVVTPTNTSAHAPSAACLKSTYFSSPSHLLVVIIGAFAMMYH